MDEVEDQKQNPKPEATELPPPPVPPVVDAEGQSFDDVTNLKVALISETYENHKILLIDPEVVLYVFPFSCFDEGDKRSTHFNIEMIGSSEKKLEIPIFFNGSFPDLSGNIMLSFFEDNNAKIGNIHKSLDTLQTQAKSNFKLFKVVQKFSEKLKPYPLLKKKLRVKYDIARFTSITSTTNKLYNALYKLLKDSSSKVSTDDDKNQSFYGVINEHEEELINQAVNEVKSL